MLGIDKTDAVIVGDCTAVVADFTVAAVDGAAAVCQVGTACDTDAVTVGRGAAVAGDCAASAVNVEIPVRIADSDVVVVGLGVIVGDVTLTAHYVNGTTMVAAYDDSIAGAGGQRRAGP